MCRGASTSTSHPSASCELTPNWESSGSGRDLPVPGCDPGHHLYHSLEKTLPCSKVQLHPPWISAHSQRSEELRWGFYLWPQHAETQFLRKSPGSSPPEGTYLACKAETLLTEVCWLINRVCPFLFPRSQDPERISPRAKRCFHLFLATAWLNSSSRRWRRRA